ncbi:DUF4349 domain-containing protein [Nocardioides dongxiaopingii]|uniref:DUF4349 domain-containing protein n=1 Tax=Nocardioides sp. S-1144 TaxID=2582905 RepID=UPI001651D67B|nr:DUF4349 domain-containing protein [Nocardioides sp. S-1144]
MTSRRGRRLGAAAATLAVLTLAVGACSSSGSDDAGGGDGSSSTELSAEAPRAAAPEAASSAQAYLADEAGSADVDSAARSANDSTASEQPAQATRPDGAAVIRNGNVALRSEDVGAAVFGVRKIVVEARGEVSDENTEADQDGAAERSMLTLRVPEATFDDVLADLKALEGTSLVDASSSSKDVTTEVIDVDVRVELQKRSIERISILLDQATSIRDVVSIERELARREADLGSLQQRQTYLADQTSMSTITVSVERPREEAPAVEEEKEKKEETGFVAGLEGGWSAFTTVATGLFTATGAVLPFAVVLLLVGVPAWVLLRRHRPVTAATSPAPAAAGGDPSA